MILCAKCKKKPDEVSESMCVLYHRYDVTVKCHGETETRSMSYAQIQEAEKVEVLFFSPSAPAAKPKRKVGPGTLGREGHVQGDRGAGS